MTNETNPAIAANIIALRDALKASADKATEAADAIAAGNRNGAIGWIADLDREIELARALHGAALGLHRMR
ncbi:hypothetical protein [Hoeflea sp.]|uniref:hypothetical protein n=1 Tax=Hoeflea sp. TaxID=1940281 RepID=UPI0019A13343|nr:hypothetical protein [Hoeflea sp.]MBC7285477.1 hypothetical protein [Hoeflea sp.]